MLRNFRYIPQPFLLLGAVEFLVLVASVHVGVHATLGEGRPAHSLTGALGFKATLFAIVMMLTMVAVGLYQRNIRYGMWGMLLRVIFGVVLGLAVTMMMFYIVPGIQIERGALIAVFVYALSGILFVRVLFFQLARKESLQRRVLVLGAGKRAAHIENLYRLSGRWGCHIAGYVHMAGEEDAVTSRFIIHRDTTLLELARREGVDEIVVAMEAPHNEFPLHEILDCRMSGIEVLDVLTFFERQQGIVNLDILQPGWLIFSDGFHYGMARIVIKRTFDVMVGLMVLMFAWPIMLMTALLILIEGKGRGPVLYRQVRVGQNWRLFQVLKFRSMQLDAEADGLARWAELNDKRITRIGAFIRKTRLDELPQIFNVLKGDMSIVGPRPERPMFVEKLSAKIPFYAERHRIKPGITGWAQVCYHYGGTEEDAIQKLQYDLYYVKNYSLFLDILIMVQTAEVILTGRGGR